MRAKGRSSERRLLRGGGTVGDSCFTVSVQLQKLVKPVISVPVRLL